MKKATNKDLWRGVTTISVREEDIILANRDSDKKGKDPVWFALKRVLPFDFKIKVLRVAIEIFPGKGNKGMRGRMPWEVQEAIQEWDESGWMDEIIFDVDFGI